jgi:hypothetical protein
MSFAEQLGRGLIGEGEISRWFISKGYSVLPAYEVEVNHGKGPRMFSAQGAFISPDLLVFNSQKVFWCEAKTKSAFTWHRSSLTWQTGIDRRHWHHYLDVAFIAPFPVWILFFHRPGNQAKDTPEGLVSPCGLFGNEIGKLRETIHHEHENHGPSGMVYWTLESLRKLSDYNSVLKL